MKISYNWLQEYFKKPLPNPKDLADLLNIRSFEVEEIEEKDGDSIFEIKITPNRAPDCLSHIGIAKEASLHTKQEIHIQDVQESVSDFQSEISIEPVDGTCVRYIAQEIQNVLVHESPLELKNKLEAIGQRSINTIVDITNLVMHEIGQPMHAFDKDKITGTIIKIAPSIQNTFITLDNKEVVLSEEDITIQDSQDDLAIAGVKGGKKAEVDFQTKNIILESANFYPVKVRKTSRKTGIQNDSSKRFENGLSPKIAEQALVLASFYIQKYASNSNTKFSNIIDIYPRPQKRKYTVGLSLDSIYKKLGVQISKEEVEKIFTQLDVEYSIVNSREEILKHAKDALGKPYKYGASVLFDAPDIFDCASLSAYAYSQAGIAIPRISIDQYVFSKKINKEEALPGDLIFANTGNTIQHGIWYETKEFLPGTKVEQGVDHVGIYLGDNQVLHANSKTGDTTIEDLDNSEYFKDIRGFGTCIEVDSKYVLHIPYERLDLKTEIDIIEEIGRVYGYEHIKPEVLSLQPVTQISTYDKVNTLKSLLINLGFDEVITYSFQKKGDIEVSKPLAKDKGALRKDLSQGLADALDLNLRNKDLFATEIIKIFEIGTVFTKVGEKLMLGIGVVSSNRKIKSKQILEETIKHISSVIKHEIKIEIKDNQTIVEIDLDPILSKVFSTNNTIEPLTHVLYKPFSLYPHMTRDIAVWAQNSKTKHDIEKIITDYATELLLRYDLFDEFSKDGKTSYAYRLVFQSFEKTLTDEEVNSIMDKIYTTLQADSDFEIR